MNKRPFAIKKYEPDVTSMVPRILLQRDDFSDRWSYLRNMPEINRWEKVINSMRVFEDRWALVEEEGYMHRVNFMLYSNRVETELQASLDNLPQFTITMKACPIKWKKMHTCCAVCRGLSVREALAQSKLSHFKGHAILHRTLEMAVQGAEGKGLDKEKLRITRVFCWPGPCDKQIDIRSKGYYAWRTKESSHLILTVVEDPDLELPDRNSVPYASLLSLRRAGLHAEPTRIDVPAITADGI